MNIFVYSKKGNGKNVCEDAAMVAGTVISDSYFEMQTLLDTLLKCDNPYTCPHGRPTTIIYTTSDLDKLFKRS